MSDHACSLRDCYRCRPYAVFSLWTTLAQFPTFAAALVFARAYPGRGNYGVSHIQNLDRCDVGRDGLTDDERQQIETATIRRAS